GFGSYRGTVVAGSAWDAPMQVMQMPAARRDSWEAALHGLEGSGHKLILTSELDNFRKKIGHRAIGVVYHPQFEAYGNYVPTIIPERYDAFLFIDETKALHAMHLQPNLKESP